MTANIWLHDATGAWLDDVTEDSGTPVAEIAYCPGLRGPHGAKVRIEGEIEQGLSLVTIKAHWWTLIDECDQTPIAKVLMGEFCE